MKNKLITFFVVAWLFVFHYESMRHFYLEPALGRALPKLKLLFPPAGWIMFFNVDEHFGFVQVYGIKEGQAYPIDPHEILQTRAIGYDNINRNVLLAVLDRQRQDPFCALLRRKFGYFDGFAVSYINYPSVVKFPFKRQESLVYECR